MRLSNWSNLAGCAVVLAVVAGCSSPPPENPAIFLAHYDDVMAGPLPATTMVAPGCSRSTVVMATA